MCPIPWVLSAMFHMQKNYVSTYAEVVPTTEWTLYSHANSRQHVLKSPNNHSRVIAEYYIPRQLRPFPAESFTRP